MDKDKEFEAYHRGYDQGRFDEYADQMGYNKAKLIKNRIEKQKNCRFCHYPFRRMRLIDVLGEDDQWQRFYAERRADALIDMKLVIQKSWEGTQTINLYSYYPNNCPACGRPLGGNEDD